MLKACLDKLIPNARPTSRVEIPGLDEESTTCDLLLSRVASGEVSLEDAKMVMSILEGKARLQEHGEFAERLEALERAYEENRY